MSPQMPTGHHLYQDPSVSIDERVEDLLARMPLTDKVGLFFHTLVGVGDPDQPHPMFGFPAVTELIDSGITHFNILGSAPDGRQFAKWHNQIQRIALERPLGIPVTFSTDPRHHFTDNPLTQMMAGPFSQWPEMLGLAAIGSEQLVETFADIARQEYLAAGIRVALHPQIDLATEPRWARISATFGEDADLTSRLVGSYILGFQRRDFGADSVSTMTKHFPGGGPQKDGTDPHFATGREQVYPGNNFGYHLQPFEAAIAAGTRQMMPYYGMPVGTEYEEVGFGFNQGIITGLLREHLGFDGIVCTDWGLIVDHADAGDIGTARAWGVEHLSVPDRVLKAINAGVDQFGGEECVDVLVALVDDGKVSESRIDQSARRLLREKFLLGLFDRPFVDEDAAAATIGRKDFRAAGLQAQKHAVTLLVNRPAADGGPTLPLRRGIKVYAEGISPEALSAYATPVADPTDAEVALVRLQAPYQAGGDGFAAFFHQGSLEFPVERLETLDALCATVPTVIDVYLDRPAVLTEIAGTAAGLVANYGIAEAALLSVLFGESDPRGRLPFDLPRSDAAVIASDGDVPFATEDPVFRFGHGLRYAATS
ncbi:glycoside hydrolase family 3 protein [Mycobacterium sp. AT1]|uniref:glycoside hydrolase family 3 protein n=1 Tax=Mycobacterium sp. AT1 TaxID=1961706 RepID=UPI0009ADB75F|nr:glycoside hydrolase family 3 N-terminal domain-containing protein [Mycobacterium sp. AT1]OPX12478.1 beta-glucosidase [Mycobacterium sp. AT1]